ncbi:unnamed protein product [Clavelina lepadiformis]|uniref:Uncharacterized protein n=1 Tax=Clavelina lepadiformis TaxID=159417 RepID=A0ABP0G170_CLALP
MHVLQDRTLAQTIDTELRGSLNFYKAARLVTTADSEGSNTLPVNSTARMEPTCIMVDEIRATSKDFTTTMRDIMHQQQTRFQRFEVTVPSFRQDMIDVRSEVTDPAQTRVPQHDEIPRQDAATTSRIAFNGNIQDHLKLLTAGCFWVDHLMSHAGYRSRILG